jgi:1-pyrroline-5-carboxylate dehydrogenase
VRFSRSDGNRPASNRDTFEDRSPADTDILIGRFQKATAEDIRAAIDTAHRSFYEWSRMPWPERLRIMRNAADLINQRRFEIAAVMSFEAGKARFEALADAEESADLIRYYCDQMEAANGFDRPMGRLYPNEKTRDILRPYGVWVVISPFNFPLALGTGMAAGALIAGNTVVHKPASDTPATALKLYEILKDAGVPAGVFSFITGSGSTVGDELVTNPKVSGVVFTGSKDVGLAIYRKFNLGLPRPCILELGGKNPAIVTARADLDKAAEGVARSAFGYGGQKCSACSRVYVESKVSDAFKELLIEKTRYSGRSPPGARHVPRASHQQAAYLRFSPGSTDSRSSESS